MTDPERSKKRVFLELSLDELWTLSGNLMLALRDPRNIAPSRPMALQILWRVTNLLLKEGMLTREDAAIIYENEIELGSPDIAELFWALR